MLSALAIPGLPEAWLSHGTIMWVLIILSVWTFFPFVLVNVLARLQTIPPELYDAARVDGASALRQFFHVTLAPAQERAPDRPAPPGHLDVHQVRRHLAARPRRRRGGSHPDAPVFTYQRSFTYYQAGMGAVLSSVMLALLLMAVTIYFIAFPPAEDDNDA